ncbi:MAG: hypothetical protein IH623_23725 [Verrucomicrobia bacterium]|nr:hypothetical protein [Verrucomicrobiota bacterium]
MSLYRVTPFLDGNFNWDDEIQLKTQTAAEQKDRLLRSFFIGMGGAFLTALTFGLLRLFPLRFAGLTIFLGCWVPSMIKVLSDPSREPRARCGERMNRGWKPTDDDRGAEYLIGDSGRRNFYTFRFCS